MTAAPILHGPDRPDLLRPEILADLFEITAARVPGKTALIFGGRALSYGELDQAADLAAHRLIEAGVQPGQMVGLWHPRGLELLILQLAVAKTGAAWLPFDADVPTDRIAVCLDDASAVALLIDEHHGESARRQEGVSARILTASELLAPLPEGTPGPPLRRRTGALPEHTAYVIYTSGSTGKPKGIAITQASICHFLRSENARLGVREDDKVYQGFSVAFDMSFEEIWISYLVGATLWIAPKEISGDPEALPRALIENDVTVLHAVPTLLALFAQDVPGLRIINLGGEMCPQTLVERWAPGRQMFNTYGPTEATVSASLAELRAGEPVTIGEALPNYGLLVIEVIDADSIAGGQVPPLKILPFGETGELCITGPGVAAGYLGRPELTAEKFLPNPWARNAQEARLYRTGDLARVETRANGEPQMQCLGRADDQVKIRGFRVELGEIEAVLAQQAGVGTTAVLLRKDDEIDQLVAFYVPSGSIKPSVQALRAGLAEKLPLTWFRHASSP
ncbi:amino acid adenylation domain-containing protein [Ottowia sp. VDI28]|uniref:amino acid adenylation domain-containing protein n=1 Tax=Ottowia sp. VDI28 TaxID=3133968 RepID=UPI003C2DCD2A